MKYKDKTKEQLINELAELHQRVEDLDAEATKRKKAEEALKVSERNGRRKNIGTGEVSKAAEGKATMTAGGVVITTAKDEMNKKVGINRTKEEL
jgi:hypothetical protein